MSLSLNVRGLDITKLEYQSIYRLRNDHGMDSVVSSSQHFRRVIRDVSKQISQITEQWYVPVIGTVDLDGRESVTVPLPNNIPWLEASAVALVSRGLEDAETATSLETKNWVVQERYLQLVRVRLQQTRELVGTGMGVSGLHQYERGVDNKFLAIPQYVRVTGAWGWLEDVSKVTTTLGAALSKDEEEATLASVEGIEEDDILYISDANGWQRAWVAKIDTANKKVTIDPAWRDAENGAAVIRWGQVPSGIKDACMLLVKDRMCPEQREATMKDDRLAPGLFTAPTGLNTGILRVDQTLNQYTAPGLVRAV